MLLFTTHACIKRERRERGNFFISLWCGYAGYRENEGTTLNKSYLALIVKQDATRNQNVASCCVFFFVFCFVLCFFFSLLAWVNSIKSKSTIMVGGGKKDTKTPRYQDNVILMLLMSPRKCSKKCLILTQILQAHTSVSEI